MAQLELLDYRQKFTAQGSWGTGAGPAADPAVPGKTKERLFVTRIVIVITTSAAVSVTVRDSGTPTPLLHVPASAPVGVYAVEFGDLGWGVGSGLDIDVASSGAGTAGVYQIEGFRRSTVVPKTLAESAANV